MVHELQSHDFFFILRISITTLCVAMDLSTDRATGGDQNIKSPQSVKVTASAHKEYPILHIKCIIDFRSVEQIENGNE